MYDELAAWGVVDDAGILLFSCSEVFVMSKSVELVLLLNGDGLTLDLMDGR